MVLSLSLLPWMAAHAHDKGAGGPLDPARGCVFAGASAERLARTLVRSEDLGGTWDPGSAQITALESALAPELSRHLRADQGAERLPPTVRDYYRQYAGITLKGQKLILINGFYRSHVEYTTAWLAQPRSEAELAAFPAEARNKDYWHYVPVVVLDGGERYFEAFYDPVHRRITGFWSLGSDLSQGYNPSLGSIGDWLATGPNPGSAGGAATLAGSAISQFLSGCN